MRYSLSSSFTRTGWMTLGAMLLLSAAGRALTLSGGAASCAAWPFCVPRAAPGWFGVLHVGAAGLTALLLTRLFIQAWREQRDDALLLPLATVTLVLFLGQVLVGAQQVAQNFPAHLVVLHSLSTGLVWLSLVTLVMVSGWRARDGKQFVKIGLRQRLADFWTLNKPRIVALLLFTTFGGLVVGGRTWPAAGLALWTMLGGALAASGASALNQYIDRELDRRMQRTARRPLAAGRLMAAEGLSYGLALCLLSYYILACFVNLSAALLSLTGIVYYVVVYSLWLKKATVQNIVIGGGAGAIPPVVGWVAASGRLSLAAWFLFLVIFLWTPPHFWALALVRRREYARASLPMLPVVKGEAATRRLIWRYTLLLVGVTLLLPPIGAAGGIYAVSAVGLGLWLIYAAWRVYREGGNKTAWTLYRSSSVYLASIFFALMIDALA